VRGLRKKNICSGSILAANFRGIKKGGVGPNLLINLGRESECLGREQKVKVFNNERTTDTYGERPITHNLASVSRGGERIKIAECTTGEGESFRKTVLNYKTRAEK